MAATRPTSGLNEAQKSFILASMDYLLEFPLTPDSLTNMVEHLITYLGDSSAPNIPDDIKQLCQFIQTPQDSFYRLDQQNQQPVSVAEVKQHVIELVTQHIRQAEVKAKIKTKWNEELILKNQPTDVDHATVLTSQNRRLHEQGTLWEQRAHHPEKIYSYDIDFEEQANEITTHMKAKILDGPELTHSFTLSAVPHIYFLDSTAIELIVDKIDVLTIYWAIDEVEKILLDKNIIPSELPAIPATSYTAQLITDKQYLSLLINQKITFYQLLDIENADQYKTLMKPAVKQLLEEGILRFAYAQRLLADKVNLISHPTYFPLFLNRTLVISDIKTAQCRLLITPCVAQLIASKKISIELALSLPTYLKPIFLKHNFSNYFHSNHIDWSSWMQVECSTIPILSEPSIEKLILNSSLSISDLNELVKSSPAKIDYLKDKNILKLIKEGELSIEKFKMSSYRSLHRLSAQSEPFNYKFFSDRSGGNSSSTSNNRPKY